VAAGRILPAVQDAPASIVVFQLDRQRYALELEAVDRVVRVVAVTPLPSAPLVVRGVIQYGGGVVPVVDLRTRFRLELREPKLSDHLVLAHTARRRLALPVDAVTGVEIVQPGEWLQADAVLPNADHLAGVVQRDDGLILIQDLDAFLSLDEAAALDGALADGGGAR